MLLSATLAFEVADLNAFGFVAPKLKEEWHLSLESVGWITSLTFLGMFVGCVVGGRLGDRIGRRPSLVATTSFFSVFSLLSATATNVEILGAYRIITGAGLTAATVVALTYASEMYPRATRGRCLAWIFGGSLIGIPTMSWFARGVVPAGDDGWRLVFVAGGLGVVVAALMVRYLPESVRWQASRGDQRLAGQQLARMEADAVRALGRPLRPPVLESPRPEAHLRDLFAPTYRKRTLVYLATSTLSMLGFYGYQSMLPTLLVARGFDVVTSLTFVSIVQVGAIPGALAAYPLIDRWQRKNLAGILYIVIAALAMAYGFADTAGVIVTVGFLVAMLLQTSTIVFYTYAPEIFPTELRAFGSGLGNGLGRLATFGGANLLPVLYRSAGYSSIFIYVAVVLCGTAVLLLVFGEQTRGRSLEDLARRTTDGDEVAATTVARDEPGSTPA